MDVKVCCLFVCLRLCLNVCIYVYGGIVMNGYDKLSMNMIMVLCMGKVYGTDCIGKVCMESWVGYVLKWRLLCCMDMKRDITSEQECLSKVYRYWCVGKVYRYECVGKVSMYKCMDVKILI